MRYPHLIAGMLLSLAAHAAPAADFTLGELTITSPWARPLPPISDNGAAYLGVNNHAMHADRLLDASSPIAERVEFHTHVQRGNMMMMEKMPAVDIAAHGTVNMAPGGMHVMLIGLKQPLIEGQRFPLTLHFEKAGSATVTVAVETREAASPATPMSHQQGKHTK